MNESYTFADLAGGSDFATFARWLAVCPPISPLLIPMYKWLADVRRDATLHLETLRTDLARLWWWDGGDVPVLNSAITKPAPDQSKIPWPHHITPDLISHLQAWCGPDLEMFGYDWPLRRQDSA